MKRLAITSVLLAALVILAFAFSPKPRAQDRKRLMFQVAFTQKDAPVQMVSVTHTLEFLYGSAKVKNVSSQTIRAITFGVLLHELGPDWSTAVIVSSRKI